MHLLMLTVSVMKWQVESFDFTSAFLQGDMLEKEVFLIPPLDVCLESQVWKLKHCIYGLNDTICSWYKRVNHEFTIIYPTGEQ